MSPWLSGPLLLLVAAPLTTATPEPVVSRERAQEILFGPAPPPLPCDTGPDAEQIACLLAARYSKDPAAQKLAAALFAQTGTVMGVLAEQDFDGGYRGTLHLVPHLPVGKDRQHLQWAASALLDFDDFFHGLGGTPRYRWRALDFRFFESVKRRTPSAFAVNWTVAYNVSGSLLVSDAGVRGTLFHEVFHLNDQARGNWSHHALLSLYDRIVARCGTTTACLQPYAPDHIKVYGGTYYDFTPGNGVGEYAADVARRYYEEHRALLRHERALPPFKCGTEENAKAWALVAEEFFGGVDLVPACTSK